ncbi:MAG: 50S ribosomal protein L4 [Elusimicrobia bacterium]|nr:50S ribosomal protein L4 [Elusimicrobiota bacterium]
MNPLKKKNKKEKAVEKKSAKKPSPKEAPSKKAKAAKKAGEDKVEAKKPKAPPKAKKQPEKKADVKEIKSEIPKLEKELKDIKVNQGLIHEVIDAYLSNRHRGNAHTKTRAEVSGGGKKPWRQKGTGRARVGSNRSPIWRGGGIVFGPRNERTYFKKVNAKKKRKALMQVVVQKIREKNLRVVDEIKLAEPKTRYAADFIVGVFRERDSSVLMLIENRDPQIIRSFRNIRNVTITDWKNAEVYSMVKNDKILYSKAAWDNFMKVRGTNG